MLMRLKYQGVTGHRIGSIEEGLGIDSMSNSKLEPVRYATLDLNKNASILLIPV